MTVGAAIAFTFALSVALALFQFGARRIYDYNVTSTGFELRLFGRFPIYRIATQEIAAAGIWRFWSFHVGAVFTTLRLGNRIVGRTVVIERRRGFPRYILITPDNSQEVLLNLRPAIIYDT